VNAILLERARCSGAVAHPSSLTLRGKEKDSVVTYCGRSKLGEKSRCRLRVDNSFTRTFGDVVWGASNRCFQLTIKGFTIVTPHLAG
jgi:hypothetical protein